MPHGNRDSAYSDDSMSVAIGHEDTCDGKIRAYETDRTSNSFYADGIARSPELRTPGRVSKLPLHDAGDYDAACTFAGEGAVLSAPATVPLQHTSITLPRSANAKRANRISVITSRSLYNIHEPESTSALGLHLDDREESRESSEYNYDPHLTRSSETPSSGVPSLTHSSQTSSAGYSTGYSTPVPQRKVFIAEEQAQPKSKKEKRLGKALLGKLKSLLLAPQSPASAERDIKNASKGRRRRAKRTAPTIEERSSSLYRTVDVPDPINLAPVARDRRASAFCSGPYGNLAAYGTSIFDSSASVGFNRPSAYASVADFRHYSTAELPLDPTVPYSPYANAHEASRWSTFIEPTFSPVASGDLALGTDRVKLKEKGGSDWASRSKQFWSSALDLTLPRSNKRLSTTMSTADLAPQPTPSAGLVPAPPPVPARSRLRGPPSNGNINGSSKQGSPSRTPRTPITQLPSSPSDSSISSSSSASAAAGSPGVPITPATPSFTSLADAAPTLPTGVSHTKYGSMGRSEGGPAWPGKLEQSPTSPAHGATADRRRSRFGRGRHSSSSSVTLRASADPMRIKDGVAPRGSSSGVYTPPTFPGPSPRPSMHSHNPSFASSVNMGPTMRSASGSSESSSTSSNFSIPQTPTSPSAAASRMYSACIGALSVWSISSGSGSSKRASNPAKPISGPVGSPVHVESGPMSAAAAYFPGSSRNSSFSQLHPKHQTSRSVSYTSAHSSEQYTPVQVWSPENGWTSAAGLGVGVEEEGNYAQGLTRSSTSSTPQLGPAVIMADAPKGRRKPVPRVEGESQEVHAL